MNKASHIKLLQEKIAETTNGMELLEPEHDIQYYVDHPMIPLSCIFIAHNRLNRKLCRLYRKLAGATSNRSWKAPKYTKRQKREYALFKNSNQEAMRVLVLDQKNHIDAFKVVANLETAKQLFFDESCKTWLFSWILRHYTMSHKEMPFGKKIIDMDQYKFVLREPQMQQLYSRLHPYHPPKRPIECITIDDSDDEEQTCITIDDSDDEKPTCIPVTPANKRKCDDLYDDESEPIIPATRIEFVHKQVKFNTKVVVTHYNNKNSVTHEIELCSDPNIWGLNDDRESPRDWPILKTLGGEF